MRTERLVTLKKRGTLSKLAVSSVAAHVHVAVCPSCIGRSLVRRIVRVSIVLTLNDGTGIIL